MRSAPSPVVVVLLADLTTPRRGEFGLRAGQVAGTDRAGLPSLPHSNFGGPPGWADGFTHSRASKFECAKLIEKLPAYARGATKCIVKIDPNAKKPEA